MELVDITDVSENMINRFICEKYKIGESFFKEKALKMHKNRARYTYVLLSNTLEHGDDNDIIGFFTYSILPVKMAKSTKKKLNLYLSKRYTSLYLNYFVLNENYRSKSTDSHLKYSTILMFNFLLKSVEILELVPTALISLHAVPGTEKFYEKFEFIFMRPENKTNYYAMVSSYSEHLIHPKTENSLFKALLQQLKIE